MQKSKCLALLSITWRALGSKGSTRLRGLWGKVPKTLHEVFHQVLQKLSVGARLRLHRRGPIATSGPDDTVGARSGPDCAVGARLSRALYHLSWHRLVLLDTVVRPHPEESRRLGLVRARLHHGTIEPWSGHDCAVGPRSGPNCTVGPRSGPDCAVGPRSGRDCAVT